MSLSHLHRQASYEMKVTQAQKLGKDAETEEGSESGSIYCSIVYSVKLVPNLYLAEAALYRYILPHNP